MKEARAFGSWVSSISSADLVRGALRLSAPRIEAGVLYWLEGRPSEGGRQAVMAAPLQESGDAVPAERVRSGIWEASPAGVNVRTRVHEYGGGEFTVFRDRLFYVDDEAGQIFQIRVRAGVTASGAQPLTQTSGRFADLVVSADGRWLFAVEECPVEGSEPENRLVAIALDAAQGSASAPRTVASGHDFYASPVVSPSGDRLAWLAWDHPHMPWNETVLESCGWGDHGRSGTPTRVAGVPGESLFQPRFDATGSLFVVSDRSGWWNLVRTAAAPAEPVPVHSAQAEIGRAQWVFGQSSWAFSGPSRVLASATRQGMDDLVEIDLDSGATREITTGFRSIGGLQTQAGWVTCVAGRGDAASAIWLWQADGGAPELIRASADQESSVGAVSQADARSFPSVDGRTTHAFVYAPTSDRFVGPAGERPPLLVKTHGGPTSSTSAALDPRIQFWTSRGFAVADVNYGGSTGYGRAYRDLLETQWGVVDVEDCVAVARALAEEGFVDGGRLAISGGSAGGYTTLCALTFHEAFSAGASHYGIGDLESLARDTHKFESRYTDWLVGPLPETLERYHARSPIHHPERLGCPMIFFQGLEDRVVPPNQAESMVAVLADREIPHAYVPFEGEQHGFRRAENIRTALEGELYFYSRVFGFDAVQPPGVEVACLPDR